ncbi:MAG: alginate lyase family protein [Cyclobacteriaceae bacterium]
MNLFFRHAFIITLLFFFSEKVQGQKSWKEINTASDLYESYPLLLENMFIQFNLDQIGLEKVKSAYEKGNIVAASDYLLEYYKTSQTSSHYRRALPEETNKTIASADTILKNVFTIQNVKGKVPWDEDGHRDWYYKGPNNDREWAWLSNRHQQLMTVYEAYSSTGNPKYLNYIDSFLRDFILKSQPYPSEKSSGAIWRGLEVSFRIKAWTRIFYGFINNELINPATKLLILSSLLDHADYNRNYHSNHGNWLTMELSALAEVSVNFTEYKNSNQWLEYAFQKMTEEVNEQVYPDGVQKELSSHYHTVTLKNFEEFKSIYELTGQQIPDSFNRTLAQMNNYLAKSIRPNGFGVLNNDSDLVNNRGRILEAAKIFNRPDWEYIASNGKSGEIPEEGPSYFFPWAGQLISRSNYDEDAHWSFFDVGPWGIGHQHNDKLHISISAYGRDLLVDAGRFAYSGRVAERFKTYARGSASHNVILIDDKGQGKGAKVVKKPLSQDSFEITDSFDFATGSFDSFNDVEGQVKHQRSVLYVRDDFWVVVDNIHTDRPRDVEILWHWHPDAKVIKDKNVTKTKNKKGNLAIIPLGDYDYKIEFKKGVENPSPQGWYSPEYNEYMPNVESSYITKIDTNATFVWILQPFKKKGAALLKSKIISKNEIQIDIEVTSKKNTYLIKIPYYNSNNVTVARD